MNCEDKGERECEDGGPQAEITCPEDEGVRLRGSANPEDGGSRVEGHRGRSRALVVLLFTWSPSESLNRRL